MVPELPFSLYQDPSLPPSPSNPNPNLNLSHSNPNPNLNPSPSPSLAGEVGPRQPASASAAQKFLRYCMEAAAAAAGTLTSLLLQEEAEAEAGPGQVSDEPPQPQQQPGKKGVGEESAVQWGYLAPLAVLKLSAKAKTDVNLTDPDPDPDPSHGSLILRLLPATRGEVR